MKNKKTNKIEKRENDWYRLDNSAKIYPAIMNDRQSTLFRVAFTLKKDIIPEKLQEALELINPRFPYFSVSLRSGFFWNYLERNHERPSIHCDTPSPCENINAIYNNGFLYKVMYFKKRIAVEFSHVMSDGYGALEFSKTLVFHYLKLTGHSIENDESIFNIKDTPHEGEFWDDHKRYSDIYGKPSKDEKERNLFGKIKAFLVKGKVLPADQFNVITGIMPLNDLKKISNFYGVTITEFLVAVYLETLIEVQNIQVKNPTKYRSVALQVPVNMRNRLESISMRNFSLFVTPTLSPPDFPEFKELVAFTSEFIKKYTKTNHLVNILRDNVSVGENPLVKHVPLFLKLPITKYLVNTSGSSQHSGTLSNLGLVKLPEEMKKQIDSITCNLSPDPHSKTSAAAIGYNGNLYITFGRVIKSAVVEKIFFRKLKKFGVSIKIQSNC